jgi:hypothetical protein
MPRVALMVVMGLLVGGCQTIHTVENEPLSAGATRNFNSAIDSVAAAAKASVADVGLKLKGEKSIRGGLMLLAERGVTGWSWGEVVRVLILSNTANTTVRVVTDRAEMANVTAKDFAEDIFTRIGQRLGEYR